MSVNDFRMNMVELLGFFAQTEEEKELASEAAEEIYAAESDERAYLIAEKYRPKLFPCSIANIVDVIYIILKGGHIVKYAPDSRYTSYLVFIPAPDPPKKKTLVGHITKIQFHELCDKGIITERKDMQHTDGRGCSYSYYYLAEEIFYGIRGEALNRNNSLSLDVLKQMQGEPVWVRDQGGKGIPVCGIVHNNCIVFPSGSVVWLDDNAGDVKCGSWWFAYRYKPLEG